MATQSNKEVLLGGLRKLLKKEWQADVLLKAGGSDEGSAISAHKLFSGISMVFKKLMESDEFKASSKIETVILSEMKHKEVKALVEFMYSADGSILLKASGNMFGRSILQLTNTRFRIYVPDLCRNQLISSLNSSNVLNTLELAQIPFDRALHDAAFTTIVNNLRTIASSAQFKLFVVNHSNLSVDIMKASLTWSNNPNLTPGGGNRYCRSCGSFCRICG